ncbi:unnamed protein product [Mucor hiemalis]
MNLQMQAEKPWVLSKEYRSLYSEYDLQVNFWGFVFKTWYFTWHFNICAQFKNFIRGFRGQKTHFSRHLLHKYPERNRINASPISRWQ